MIREMCCLAVPVLIFGLAGCGMLPDTQLLPEQVLAGDWVTTTDTGEDAVVTFDEMGAILSVLVESSMVAASCKTLPECPRSWIGTPCSSQS